MRQKGIVSANTNYLPTMSLWNAVVCGRDSDILSCGRDGGLDSNKPARDRGRTQEPSMLSSTPSRFRRPEGFPPSYFGNRLAGEDPVRQSRPPEPTQTPVRCRKGVVVEQREHAAMIRHPHPLPVRRLTPTRPHPHGHAHIPCMDGATPFVPRQARQCGHFSARRSQQAFPSSPSSNPARC